MNLNKVFMSLFFVLPVSMYAHIVGTYNVTGFDPYSDQHYAAILVIEKSGSVYTADWTYEDSSHNFGTGVRKDDSIAFVYSDEGQTYFGVQVYEIDDNTLSGPWANYGELIKGHETAKKIEN